MIFLKRFTKYFSSKRVAIRRSKVRWKNLRERQEDNDFICNDVRQSFNITEKRHPHGREMNIYITGFNIHRFEYNISIDKYYNRSKTIITYKWSLNKVSDEVQLTEIINIHDLMGYKRSLNDSSNCSSNSATKTDPQNTTNKQNTANKQTSIKQNNNLSIKDKVINAIKRFRNKKQKVKQPTETNLQIIQSFQINGPLDIVFNGSYNVLDSEVKLTKKIRHEGCLCGGKYHCIPQLKDFADDNDCDEDNNNDDNNTNNEPICR